MSKKQKGNELNDAIFNALMGAKVPLSRGEISERLINPPSPKTIQRYILNLCNSGRVESSGNRSAKKYFITNSVASETGEYIVKDMADVPESKRDLFSKESLVKFKYFETPSFARKKKTYNSGLVENYIANKTKYISVEMRSSMLKAGVRFDKDLAAGTYAKEIVQRLLIDLSYNSSRLEGNTYSLLDTKRLLEEGVTADGTLNEESIMILNHKEAILFLVENAIELEVTSFVIRNLHQLLSQDLLSNQHACGKVRQIAVGISRSAYTPLNNAQQLEEHLVLILRKAQKKKNV